jgi:prophage DNA circulation protein
MSWRDRLQPASFRGVPFEVDDHRRDVGRRTEIHEFPFRDQPAGEDLGRATRKFNVEAYVFGPDYDVARDALIEALETRGAGTLVHPLYGRRRVMIEGPASLNENTSKEGGIAKFSIVFIEADEIRLPAASTDTQTDVADSSAAARVTAESDFVEKFDLSQLPSDLVQQVQEHITGVLDFVDGITETVADFIQLPADLATAIYDGVKNLKDSLQNTARALNSYKALFNAGESSEPVPQTTSTRIAQAGVTDAVNQLIRRAAVIEACNVSAELEYSATADAHAALELLLDGLDLSQEAVDINGLPISDTVYDALADLRRATATDIRERSLKLPVIASHTPARTLPALVIAHQVYGDATRESEIIERNNIQHPGFVAGGEALEVLSDV